MFLLIRVPLKDLSWQYANDAFVKLLDFEVNKPVEMIGTSGIFYAIALKTLKRDFRSPLLISHFCLKKFFDKPQIWANGRINLWPGSPKTKIKYYMVNVSRLQSSNFLEWQFNKNNHPATLAVTSDFRKSPKRVTW